jgi:hypothetical protein
MRSQMIEESGGGGDDQGLRLQMIEQTGRLLAVAMARYLQRRQQQFA